MQGLPTQIPLKSPKTEVFDEKKASAKTEVNGSVEDGSAVEDKSGFSSLFANLTGKEGAANKTGKKASEVKSETGDALKNLLAEKNKENAEGKTDPLAALALMGHATAAQSKNTDGKVEQKIAKSSSNLDQLLNSLKGSTESNETNESEESDKAGKADSLQGMRSKKGEHQIKGELKSESPLDFLMKGAKGKSVGEGVEIVSPKESEGLQSSKKVMTGEDYLKNFESKDTKTAAGKLSLINGLADLQKNNAQNVKGYGQGLSLLSDPIIKNTKDLAFKDGKKSHSASAIDELRTPDTKVGAELSAIKQDVIPGIQNKNNHGQQAETQTQANQKVLDLGKLNTANTTEIIKRISDYVEQNQVANKSSLDLTVKHESLGEFKIQVTKMPSSANQAQNLIDMQISTSNKEGHDFFVKNEVSLMKNLNQAGINLSDLRIVSNMSESTAFGKSDSKQSSSFSQNPDGTEKSFTSFESNNFSSDTGKGSERRKELWEEYQQRYGA